MECRSKSDALRELGESMDVEENCCIKFKRKKSDKIMTITLLIEQEETLVDEKGQVWVRKVQ